MVQRIEPSLAIPGLKKALVKMLHDYNLQVSVQEGCKKILSNDYFNLHERLVKSQQKGIFVDGKFYLVYFTYNKIDNLVCFQTIKCAELVIGKLSSEVGVFPVFTHF